MKSLIDELAELYSNPSRPITKELIKNLELRIKMLNDENADEETKNIWKDIHDFVFEKTPKERKTLYQLLWRFKGYIPRNELFNRRPDIDITVNASRKKFPK